MPPALFLASTPLHSFWALGLAAGCFAGRECVLALIDQRAGDRDFIAEAVAQLPGAPISRVARFPQIGKGPAAKLLRARAVMRSVEQFVEELRPSYIAVGNDRRAEFYAALKAAPAATGAYLDDGMFSYMAMPQRGLATESGLAAWMRRRLYGAPVEHPAFVGGSRAAREAWVLLPGQVHAGLAGKQVRSLEPEWFRQPPVQAVCERALALAGVEAERIRRIRLLLLLPHDSFLREQPALRQRIVQIADAARSRGELVAVKRHPRSPVQDSLLPPDAAMEIPRRLPVELLAPLLSDALVLGTLTTALLSLKRLSANTRVATYPSAEPVEAPSTRIYRSIGILPLE